ncbi:MAG: hypothetical protein AAFW73_21765 [Bacteroidota bacterium]
MQAYQDDTRVAFIASPVTDSKTFYYLAAGPQVALIDGDPKRPRVRMDVYRKREEAAFYAKFQFMAELYVSPERAEAAARAEGLQYDLLLPLQATAADLTVTLPGFVEPVVLPAAIGARNVAIFNMGLENVDQIQLLEALLRSPEGTPIGLSYQIDYLTTMPPSRFEISAEYERVYDYLKESFGFDLLVVRTDFTNIYSELRTRQIVTVKIVAGSGNLDQQINTELTNMILTSFFEPVYLMEEEGEDLLSGFGFYLKRTIIEGQKFGSLSAKIEETAVVKRSVFPNSTYDQFVANSDYRDVKVVYHHEEENDFFKDREILIHLLDENLAEDIVGITVRLRYDGGEATQIVFTQDDLKPKRYKVKAKLNNQQRMIWPVSYHYTIDYIGQDGKAAKIDSPERITESTELYLNIDAVLTNYHFRGEVFPTFDWNWFSSVRVKLAAHNQANPPIEATFFVDQSHPTFQHHWLLRYSEEDPYRFKADYTFSNVDNRHLPGPAELPVNQLVLVPLAAYPQRQLTIVQDYDWTLVGQVILNVHYTNRTDPEHQATEDFVLEDQAPQSVFFTADQPERDLRAVDLDVLIIYKDATSITESYRTDADLFTLPNPLPTL